MTLPLHEKPQHHNQQPIKEWATTDATIQPSQDELTCSSSAGVKSFLMLKVFLISSGDFPLIMLATVLQVTSSKPLMSK